MTIAPESPLFGQGRQSVERLVQNIEEASEPDEVIHAATRGTVSNLADLAVLVLFRREDHHRVEVAAREPDRERKASELVTQTLPALERVARRAWQNGHHFRWLARINARSIHFLRVEPELVQLLTQLDISSLVVVPLKLGSQPLGALALARTSGSGKWYQASDLALAQIVARRTAVAIESAELRQRHQDEKHRRHRLEGALHKWVRVFDVAGWGAAIVDAEKLRIDAANPAFARMHGYSDPEALGGQPYSILLAPDCAGETAEWTNHEEGSHTYESVHVRLNGGGIPVLTSVTSLDLAGGTKAYVVTVQDVTELKRAEERLRRAQRMEAVGRLAGGVAHEVNNMMTIILGFSDLLTGAVDLPPARQRDVDEIRKAAIRTARVTQQLLAFSRQQILQPIDLQLNEIVIEMSSVLQHLLPTNVKVELVLSPVPAVVHADRAQIDQVLINLAFNARDAMPLGGTLRLATDSRHLEPDDGRRLIGISIPRGRYAVLSVSDTGHGMTPDTLNQVFEPFFTTKPAGTGTGLGLATVYGIVKQSGGFIWVESEPDIGTTFTLCFPEVESRKSTPAEPPHEEPQGQSRPSATVLIVEDEDGVRELARRVLEQEGYSVLDVKSGADAIAALDGGASDIDLMLVDVVTPDLAAIELEADVRARRPELPLLYMSGYSWEEVVSRGLVSGQRPFIQKPFTAAELVRAVAQELAPGKPVVVR